MTLNAPPAVWGPPAGVTSNEAAAAGLTVIECEPLIDPVTVSVAVTDCEPAVVRVAENACEPASPPTKV